MLKLIELAEHVKRALKRPRTNRVSDQLSGVNRTEDVYCCSYPSEKTFPSSPSSHSIDNGIFIIFIYRICCVPSGRGAAAEIPACLKGRIARQGVPHVLCSFLPLHGYSFVQLPWKSRSSSIFLGATGTYFIQALH